MKTLLERTKELPQNTGEYGNRLRKAIKRLEYFERTKEIEAEMVLIREEICLLERWRIIINLNA